MQKLYIILILLLPALGIGVYAGAVYIIDPYGFYHPLDRGVFPIKPAMVENQNMVKAQIVRKTRPDTVIIGSSRVDYAIDPAHPYFKGKHVYNMGVKGVRIPELKAIIEHAHYSGARKILWGIDFFSFNALMDRRPDFSKDRLYDGTNNPDRDLKTLISLNALKGSIKALIYKDNESVPHTLINGKHSPSELDKKTKNKGAQSLFDNNAYSFLNKIYFPTPNRDFVFTNNKDENTWRDFEDTLKFIHNNNIAITFFIAPQHAYQFTLIYQSGLFNKYQKWKQDLNKMIQNYDFILHDYSAINTITTEPIPMAPNTAMRYYWESSHYRPIIGDMIMDDLMGRPSPLLPTPVTRASLARFKSNLINYQCTHPDVTNDIRMKIKRSGLENRLINPINCR